MKEKADVVHRHGARLVGQLVHLGREFIGGESDQPPMAPSPIKTVRDAYPPHELTVAEIDDDHRGLAGLDGEPRQGRARRGGDPRRARLPGRPVHVAADQPADRHLRRLVREPDALPAPGDRGDALGHARPGSRSASGSAARRRSPAAWASTTACGSPRTSPRWAASTTSASPTARGATTSRTPPVPTPWRSPRRRGSAPRPACPTLVGQRIRDVGTAEHVIKAGHADLVGMARALIADPDLPVKSQTGRLDEIRGCLGINQDCRAFDPHLHCAVNAEVGRGRPATVGVQVSRRQGDLRDRWRPGRAGGGPGQRGARSSGHPLRARRPRSEERCGSRRPHHTARP